MRSINLNIAQTNTEDYEGLEVYIFEHDTADFLNSTANPNNANFNINIDGTTNIT
jgi:hypothetical protein